MIVTLAGHVDHGKTSLVRALTGVDTDRLEQEKQRGLTIDLGFAYIDNGNIGFVDVPGHHRFIHNMVAGVASHQFALLVIAADDGPMPQSREHLDILQLSGLEHGVIAMTKTDRVDMARRTECEAEIRRLVAESFLQRAPIYRTSMQNPASHASLLEHLRNQASLRRQPVADEPFRMAIDRAFLVKGAGLVVTGTIHNGLVSTEDTLHHFSSGRAIRVRGIRAQDQVVKSAAAGERCALNVTGLELAEIARGDWLATDFSPGFREITVELTVLESFPRALKHWTPVHMYHATRHAAGRIALLDGDSLVPGEKNLVDILCDEPVAVRHGDRVILRDQSLDVTLGGAAVVHGSVTYTSRRRNRQRRERLNRLRNPDNAASLSGILRYGPVNSEEYRQIRHLTAKHLKDLIGQIDALVVGGMLVSRSYWKDLQDQALAQARSHQQNDPSSQGMKENEFKSMPLTLRSALLNGLVQTDKLINTAGFYRLPEHKAELPKTLEKSWRRLETALDQPQVPSTGDLAKGWGISQEQLETDLKELARRGLVVHVANHRFYLPGQLEEIVQQVKTMAQTKPFSVRDFRDHTGIGRNVAIEILEFFDHRGFTRRQGNERVVIREAL